MFGHNSKIGDQRHRTSVFVVSLFFSPSTRTPYPSRQVVSFAIFFYGGGPISDIVAISMSSDCVSLSWIGVSVSGRLGMFEPDDLTSKVRSKNCMWGAHGQFLYLFAACSVVPFVNLLCLM